ELVAHAQFLYAHGHQGVARDVAAQDGDVTGEPSDSHAPGECTEQCADVARVDRARRRISRVLTAPCRVHHDVATGGQCCGGVLLDRGGQVRVVALEQI